MAKRKLWGQLSKRSRDRAARQAMQQYGISRRSARERYNRGTYRPFARDAASRVPADVKRRPHRYPRAMQSLDDLRDAALRNFDHHLGDYFKYNRTTVVDAIYNHAEEDALRRMAGASEDELTAWASYQENREHKGFKVTPRWLKNLGWYEDSRWRNPFWYH